MKVIDEKGRLFSKINVIDFLVILFFIFLVPMFYFAYKIMTQAEPQKREFFEIEKNCLLIKLKPELLELISIGDKELNENGEVIGEIVSLDKIEPYRYEFDIGKNQKLIKEDPILKQIEAKLKLEVEVKQDKPFYKNLEIRTKSPLTFETKKYSLYFVPLDREEWISLRVKLSDLVPEIAKVVQKGDMGKDASGKIIAKIDSIISKKPASEIVTDIFEGKLLTLPHPYNIDITVSLDVLCVEKEGAHYFKDYLAKIGNNIVVNMDLYTITGIIVGIEKK